VLLTLCMSSFAQTQLSKRIDSLFTSYLDSSLSGSVLVAEQNKVTLSKAYGYSNNETKTLNTTKTLFNIASIGKQFTVYSILLLEQEGLLITNDYLSKYVGSFNDLRDSITIHQLLIHRSGLIKESAEIDYSTRSKFIESVKTSKGTWKFLVRMQKVYEASLKPFEG
jgi:CubicO group peptidase (beta-lactamase class C family)